MHVGRSHEIVKHGNNYNSRQTAQSGRRRQQRKQLHNNCTAERRGYKCRSGLSGGFACLLPRRCRFNLRDKTPYYACLKMELL